MSELPVFLVETHKDEKLFNVKLKQYLVQQPYTRS